MDVRIGSIDSTIVDSGPGAEDKALVERVAKRVVAMLDARQRSADRAKKDRNVDSPDDADVEGYG